MLHHLILRKGSLGKHSWYTNFLFCPHVALDQVPPLSVAQSDVGTCRVVFCAAGVVLSTWAGKGNQTRNISKLRCKKKTSGPESHNWSDSTLACESLYCAVCVCVAWCCVVELVCTYSWSLGVNYVRNTVAIGMNTELNQTFDPSDSLERLYMTELPIWVWKTIFSSTLIHDAVMDIVEEFLQLTRTAPWLQHKLLHSNTKQVFKTHMVQSIPQRELTKTPCGRCWGYDKSISFLT